MEENRRYFFKDINELIRYILEKKENVGQLRLQKTLYLLYAYYGSTYGQLEKEEDPEKYEVNSEVEVNYPKELFPAEFEAWKYGPVIFDVYVKDKNSEYELVEFLPEFEPNEAYEEDVLLFLDDIIEQINDMSDFTLVDRTHQDKAWKETYKPNTYRTKMNNEDIIREYVEEYVS